ncbi:autotransporter domain-containing protein [Microvirga sp. 17 mud 1-3]|uniref:autotransporter domain-containing protein n=1 Tax=Microvirga sp. 17 mud 1-3 TaxID=2082949 RepID=UPI000D6DB73A|nr:autotransporter domain-containing protein [Microvirga sp. 17 mud 1-3]AWM86723.1 transporter [Microvirga sp. 17 mud 1-3]
MLAPGGNGTDGTGGGRGGSQPADGGTATGGANGGGGGGGFANLSGQQGGGGGGGGGSGIGLSGWVTIYNYNTITGGNGGNGFQFNGVYGAGGGGGNGITLNAAHSSEIFNDASATIAGGNGGLGSTTPGAGGGGGDGISVAGIGVRISNYGGVSGGFGGFAAGPDGNGITLLGDYGLILNAGTIEGATGIAVVGNRNTITNLGSLTGRGLMGVSLNGQNNRLELYGGSTITGQVTATGTGNVLAFGGPTNASFNTALLGSGGQYVGFDFFEKTGTGTLTLFGNNTYSGVTTVNQGTLRAGSAGSMSAASAMTVAAGAVVDLAGFDQEIGSLVGAGNILLGTGTLTTSRNGSSTTFSGNISGTGGLIKQGTGTLTLTGASTFSGGTALSAGTLAVGHSAALGTGALNMASGTTLQATAAGLTPANPITLASGIGTINDQGNLMTLSGTISGNGGLTKRGPGTLTLTGVNTYLGGTTVSGGSLAANGTGTLGSGPVNVNGGFLQLRNGFDASGMVFSTANGYTYFLGTSNAGTATLTANAGGVTSFQEGSNAGNSVVTTNAGGLTEFFGWSTGGNARLINNAGGVVDFSGSFGPAFDRKLTAGSIEGNGTFRLGANELTVGANGRSTTVAGVIQDGGMGGGIGGSLTKSGTGTLTLSGENTYTGLTTIQAGTLQIGSGGTSGNLAGDVANQATLAFNRSDAWSFAGDISGSGRVLKQGIGTLTLTGAGSYSGETVVSAGTLASGAAGAFSALSDFTVDAGATLAVTTGDEAVGSLSGAGTVTIAGGASLTTGLSDKATTFAGSFLGAGSLAIDGTATAMTLTGNSEIGGNLDICSCGDVNLRGSFKAHGDVMVAGGTLTVEQGGHLDGGSVQGIGTLTLADGGRVTTPQFAWIGGTVTITGAGSLLSADMAQVSGGIGDLDFNILNGGRMTTTGDMALLAMTGYGNVSVRGAGSRLDVGGTLAVGDSTIGVPDVDVLTLADGGRVSAGTIIVGTDGALRVGTGGAGGILSTSRLVNDGTLAFNHTDALTFDAPIEGGGSLLKSGSGRLALTGTSTLTGPTYVQAGQLAVNGSLASSPVTVTGGTLSGTGTVGRLSLQSGGTVAPGNSIGTLNVAGPLSFGPGSFYAVEIDGAGRSDRIAVTGTATLNGGTVQILPDQGINFLADHAYTILTAQGGRTGTFAGTQSTDFAFITPTLGYTADAVTLTMVRKTVPPTPPAPPPPVPPAPPVPVAFHTVAVTENQYHTADAVEALGAGNRLYNTVLGSTVAGARQAFDALSGEAHGSAVTAGYAQAGLIQTTLLTRLRQPLTSLPLLAQGAYGAAFAADRPGQAVAPVAVVPQPIAPRYALWGEGFGARGKTRSDRNAAALDTSTGGFLIGADAQVTDGWRLGLAGGYLRTALDVDARLSSGSNESVFGALYGSGQWGALTLRLGAAYARHDIDLSRTITFPGYADAVKASYDGSTLQAFGELGYRLGFGALALEPFVGASVLRLSTDGFQEQGGAAALTGYGRTYDLGTTTVGLRAEARLSETVPLTLSGLLGWRHAYGDVAPEALLAFAGGASPFTVAGVPVDRDALVAEAGLDWRASEAISLGVSYAGQIGARAQEHTVKGNFVWRFGTY